MNRRAFIAGSVGLLAAPLAAEAQARPAIIGWLATEPTPALERVRQELRDLGHVEGRGVVIETRYAGESAGRFEALATELIRLPVNVIIAPGSAAAVAARRVTTAVPVVFVSGDPVAQGLVVGLARPGGNATGMAVMSTELNSKRLELLKAAVPSLSRLAVLNDATGNTTKRFQERLARSVELAARGAGVQLLPTLDIREVGDLEPAFARAAGQRAQGLFVHSSPYFNAHRERIVRLAARHRLPTVYEHRDFPEAGGLLSYGPTWREVWRRVASYVGKILKGAKPADLPVEQPTEFELVINMKTAKALGMTIPPSVLARVDEEIE